MKNHPVRSIKETALPWLYAIITSLLLGAFFFYGFRISPQPESFPEPEWQPSSIMLESSDLDQEYRSNIRLWSLLGDPTVLIQPRPELGLSIVKRYPVPGFFTDPPPFTTTIASRQQELAAIMPAASDGREIDGREITHDWLSSRPVGLLPRPEKLPQASLPRQLVWRQAGDEMIKNPPVIAVELVRELAGREQPVRPTKLEVFRPVSSPLRFLVRQSSGNLELDRLALQALQAEFFGQPHNHHSKQEQPTTDPSQLRLPPPGTGLRVEVEWRMVLN